MKSTEERIRRAEEIEPEEKNTRARDVGKVAKHYVFSNDLWAGKVEKVGSLKRAEPCGQTRS